MAGSAPRRRFGSGWPGRRDARPRFKAQRGDVLLCTLPAAGTRWTHVDIDPARSPGMPPAEGVITSDARSFLRAAVQILKAEACWMSRGDARDAKRRGPCGLGGRHRHGCPSVVRSRRHQGRVVTTLRDVLPDDAWSRPMLGTAAWAGRGFRFRRPGTYLAPTSGAMGYGLPAAIGGSGAPRPSRRCAHGRRGTGDDPVGARDGRSGTSSRRRARLRQPALRDHPDVAGPARRRRRGRGRTSGPIDFAAAGRALGASGDSQTTPIRARPSRALVAMVRPYPSRVDRAWVSVDFGHPARCGPPITSSRTSSGTPPNADAPLSRDSLADEGFIHCTDGAEALVATANRHYRDDPRDFLRSW